MVILTSYIKELDSLAAGKLPEGAKGVYMNGWSPVFHPELSRLTAQEKRKLRKHCTKRISELSY